MSLLLAAGLLGLHLGPLHAGEKVLVYLLAFGPLVLLAFAIWRSRRRRARDTESHDV